MNERRQLVVRRIDPVTQFAQRLEQRRLRPFVHPRHAVQPIHAFAETNHRREKPRRRARVADEEFHRLFDRSAARHFPALPIDRDRSVARLRWIGCDVHHEADFLEALDHHLGVLAPERALERDFAVGQRGQDECAVRNALRARHRDLGVDGFRERDDLDQIRQSHVTPCHLRRPTTSPAGHALHAARLQSRPHRFAPVRRVPQPSVVPGPRGPSPDSRGSR